jgi:hypothetical protein
MNIEEEFRFDVRIQERMLKKGAVQKEELDQRLAALKDVADQSEIIELDPPGVTSSDV